MLRRGLLRREVRGARFAAVGRAHVIGDDLLEFLGDALALERDGLLAVDVHRRDGHFARARQADADVGHLRFARAVDHAAHDGDAHLLHAGVAGAPLRHLRAQVGLDLVGELLEVGAGRPAASRAGRHQRRERAQAHRLQDLLRDHDFARPIAAGLGRERDADRVADACLQQHRHRRGRGDDAFRSHARLGESQVQRVIAAPRELGVHRDQVLDVGDLAREHDAVARQAERFGALGAADRGHDERLAQHRRRRNGAREDARFRPSAARAAPGRGCPS